MRRDEDLSDDPYDDPVDYYPPVERPSRVKNCLYVAGSGFALGGTLGVTMGVIFGAMNVWHPSYKGKRLATVSATCMQMGGFFGLFLAAGSVVRSGC